MAWIHTRQRMAIISVTSCSAWGAHLSPIPVNGEQHDGVHNVRAVCQASNNLPGTHQGINKHMLLKQGPHSKHRAIL